MGFKERLYYHSFFIFAFLIRHTPPNIRNTIIKGVAKAAFWLDAKHRHYGEINLQQALGVSLKEAKDILKKVYENLAFNLADFIQNQNTTKEAILKKVRFENEEIYKKALESNKPLLLMGAHYGNWEILPLALTAKFKRPLSIVGRPLDSKVMDEILKQNREQFNIQLIPKRKAMKKIVAAIAKKRVIGILVDQHTTDREGVEVNFFNLKAMHTPALSLLSRKYEAPIIPVFVTSDEHKSYTITFYEPIEPIKSEDEEADILALTQAQANITEKVIRKRPQEWFWLHRRWKKALKYD